MAEFNDAELNIICMLASHGSRLMGEDIIGGILKTGGFHLLQDSDESVVKLAHKIQDRKDQFVTQYKNIVGTDW